MSPNELKKANKKLLIRFALLTVLMFGFGFSLVPLYDVFCDITGINGKTNRQAMVEPSFNPGAIDTKRNIKVQFTVTHNEQMPWEFKPDTSSISLHPGEIKSVTYYARNPTNQDMTAQAVPSVSPAEAAVYVKKIACFCFDSQKLDAQTETHMGVRFYIDKSLPEHIKTLTLSYTLFDITS